MKKILACAVFFIGILSVYLIPCFAGSKSSLPELLIFHSPSCHKCIEAKTNVLPLIEKEFQGVITLSYLDINDIENYKYMLFLKDNYKQTDGVSVPMFFLQGNFYSGKEASKEGLSKFIRYSLDNPKIFETKKQVDLTARFETFTFLAVVGVGLIDGINPCAFTVIVFFISFLALQGYRKRELIAIGGSFISAVFFTYLLIGLGVFSFIYRMSHFWVFAKIFNILIGAFSIFIAALSLIDFIKYKISGKTDGLVLQLPRVIKNQIHKVIGMHYRVNRNVQASRAEGRPIMKLIVTALATGFIVSLLEAVCTGQTYLPTITFILKTARNLKILALIYLLVYNLMFIVPLFMIFIFSLKGATSEQFGNFIKRHLLLIKAAMAVIFFILGVYLIWRS